MAKIVETVFVVKISKIVRSSDLESGDAYEDLPNTIEQVVQELVGNEIVVEVEKIGD